MACVNRNVDEVKSIAERMEALFLETLERGDEFVMNFESRKKLRMWRMGKEYYSEGSSEKKEARIRRQQRQKKKGGEAWKM